MLLHHHPTIILKVVLLLAIPSCLDGVRVVIETYRAWQLGSWPQVVHRPTSLQAGQNQQGRFCFDIFLDILVISVGTSIGGHRCTHFEKDRRPTINVDTLDNNVWRLSPISHHVRHRKSSKQASQQPRHILAAKKLCEYCFIVRSRKALNIACRRSPIKDQCFEAFRCGPSCSPITYVSLDN